VGFCHWLPAFEDCHLITPYFVEEGVELAAHLVLKVFCIRFAQCQYDVHVWQTAIVEVVQEKYSQFAVQKV
jgi:hypothetical protein